MSAAVAGDWAFLAARRLRRADYFAQFHQGLIPIAGSLRCETCLCGCCEGAPVLRSAQVAANSFYAREDARDVAVEHGERDIVSNAQHGGCGVSADTRKFKRGVQRAGELSGVLRDDSFCCAMQIARPAVVAQAGPKFQDFR